MTNSYEAHNSEYVSNGKFEYEKAGHEHNTANRVQYNQDAPLGKLLDAHPKIKIGVDIGCGSGWVANLMSQTMDKVFAIEPSAAALEIAKKIYPENQKVSWINAFAQDAIDKLQLSGPAIFNCFCVLSHLDDSDVIEIARQINVVAKSGSALSFSECFGCEFHSHLWHIRTEEWWQSQFPDWTFDFYGPGLDSPAGARKAFSAVRR